METSEQIKRFARFIETHYYADLLEHIRKGEKFLVVDYRVFASHDPELADLLLDTPEDMLKVGEMAVEEFDVEGDIKGFAIRFSNLPDSQKIMIRNIRSMHLGKFITTLGVVRQKSDVRPQVTASRFECPSCGNIIPVLQLDKKMKEPSRCGCGRKGKFRLLSKELVDAQGIVLEEAAEELEGGAQPKRINVFLKNDLVSPLSERKTNPGSKIILNGIIKEVPIILKTGGQSTRFDLLIEANYILAVEEDYSDITITDDEKEQILKLSQDPKVYQKFVSSIAPNIYGYNEIKEALVYQLMGGVRKTRDEGSGAVTRGDIHILLVGDPGAGKCVSGDTKIMMETGEIMSIKSFSEHFESHKVFSLNKDGSSFCSQPVRVWKRKAPSSLLKITTATGNELVVTEDHPLFTTRHALVFGKIAKEFDIGDYLALPSRLQVNGSLQHIPTDISLSPARNRARYFLPLYLTEDFARLLGYLVGDGYVRMRKTTGIVSFINKDPDLLDDFESLVKKIFGLSVHKRKKQKTEVFEYYFCSIDVVRILEKIDPYITHKSDGMTVCDAIARSPHQVVKEFIKALFDCEGHVSSTRQDIELSSKSKELIFYLKYLLLRFGIISQVSSAWKYAANTVNKTVREYYRLRISGESMVVYAKKIGFQSPRKQQQATLWATSKKSLNTNIYVVPHVGGLLSVLRRKYRLSQHAFGISRSTYQHYEREDRFPSIRNLQKISGVYLRINDQDPFIILLAQMSNAEIFWDRITKISNVPSTDEFVYDLEIDAVHNFFANGVIVHNSQLLKRIYKIAPKGRYVSGKGVTGAGLTASVVKDEFLQGWSLEAGALVLANKGQIMIDELDKMSNDDRSAMHEALEQQSVSIAKANIQATLRSETTVLAAANPKFGRFDPYQTVAEQIDLPPTLINRFDLIFPIKDLPDQKKDEQMASFILNLHQNPDIEETQIETPLLRKYIAYARQRIKPQLTDSAVQEIKDYYLKMRASGSTESGIKSIPISARQLEGLIRLSEAVAKTRLADQVSRKDARRAISLLNFCLQQIAFDVETGTIDIDRIATDMPASQRSKIVTVREIITSLENKLGKTVPLDDIKAAAKEKGLTEDDVEEAVEKLKKTGNIFEPRSGVVSRI